MSAETLRRAAAQIRNDHGGVVSRHTRDGRRWLPVADWLEDTANANERVAALVSAPAGDVLNTKALAVARAYLKESP